MEFLNPWGFFAFLSVPALIALYVLRQKHTEVTIPSLLLWQKTQTLMEASTPWQKLRRNLLFILQLLLLICLSFAVTRPALKSTNTFDEVLVVLDASASMQAAEEGDRTNFEIALAETQKLADGLKQNQKLSLILADSTVIPVLSHEDNPQEIRKQIKQLSCGYSSSRLSDAILLARSMVSDGDNCQILVYTDRTVSSEDERVVVRNLAGSRCNFAVLSLSCGVTSTGSPIALSVVESFRNSGEATLELYADDRLADAASVTLEKNVPQNVYWRHVPEGTEVLTVKIKEKDALPLDNSLSCTVRASEKNKVLLCTEDGYFLEKVLIALGENEVYKIKPSEFTPDLENDYDLYLFDGFVPDFIPEEGAVWFLHPDRALPGLSVGDSVKGSVLSKDATSLGENLGVYFRADNVLLARFFEFFPDNSWESAFSCGKYPVVLAKREASGRAVLAVAFDIQDSNLPLLKEFPILIQNMISYSLPVMTEGDGLVRTGDTVTVKTLAYSRKTQLVRPTGEITELGFGDYFIAELPGVYQIRQTVKHTEGGEEKEEVITGIVVAKIPDEESSFAGDGITEGETRSLSAALKGQTELWPYLLLACMVLLALEWWVYYHEN